MSVWLFLTDYAALKVIWWVLLGLLFWGFAFMNGFDLGVAALSATIFKTDEDRRVLLNTVGPFWEGNQIWLILGAGAIFAAWPLFYSVLFSGLYLPLFLVLVSLILRPVGFKFRSKAESKLWRQVWDVCIGIGGIVPALGFGLLLGIFHTGIGFNFDENLRLTLSPRMADFFHPLSLVSALMWLVLFITHGAIYLLIKTEGHIREKLQHFLPLRIWVSLAQFIMFLTVWSMTIPSYSVMTDPGGPCNPLAKSILVSSVPWFERLLTPWALISAMIFIFLTVGLRWAIQKKSQLAAFAISSVRMGAVLVSMGMASFPVILASKTDLQSSLTVWDASSSRRTLLILLAAVIVFLPIMIAVTCWVHKVLRGPVRSQDVKKNSAEMY